MKKYDIGNWVWVRNVGPCLVQKVTVWKVNKKSKRVYEVETLGMNEIVVTSEHIVGPASEVH